MTLGLIQGAHLWPAKDLSIRCYEYVYPIWSGKADDDGTVTLCFTQPNRHLPRTHHVTFWAAEFVL